MINFIKNKLLILTFILLTWHVLAIFQDPIILPKPFIVFKLVIKLLFIKDTYFSIIYSLMRVFLGIIFIFSFFCKRDYLKNIEYFCAFVQKVQFGIYYTINQIIKTQREIKIFEIGSGCNSHSIQ